MQLQHPVNPTPCHAHAQAPQRERVSVSTSIVRLRAAAKRRAAQEQHAQQAWRISAAGSAIQPGGPAQGLRRRSAAADGADDGRGSGGGWRDADMPTLLMLLDPNVVWRHARVRLDANLPGQYWHKGNVFVS